MISERPAEAEDRAVPGHREGDLIIGEGHRSAVGTLVERASRDAMFLHPPHGKNAENVNEAMTNAIMDFRKPCGGPSLGTRAETCAHAQFTVDTGIQVSPRPTPPWQPMAAPLEREHQRAGTPIHAQGHRPVSPQRRGSPAIRNEPEQRPRKALGFMKPSEKFAQLVALSG